MSQNWGFTVMCSKLVVTLSSQQLWPILYAPVQCLHFDCVHIIIPPPTHTHIHLHAHTHTHTSTCTHTHTHIYTHTHTSQTRMMALVPDPKATYRNLFQAFYKIATQENPRALFRGMGIVATGAGPAHALYFSCYEFAKKSLSGGNRSNFLTQGTKTEPRLFESLVPSLPESPPPSEAFWKQEFKARKRNALIGSLLLSSLLLETPS